MIADALRSLPAIGKAFAPGEIPVGGRKVSFREGLPRERNASLSVGDGSNTSIVEAVINWYVNAYPEAVLRVTKGKKNDHEPIDPHPLTDLIANPNPYYSEDEMLAGMIFSDIIDGNSYLLKLRNGAGRVVELWWIPHTIIEPKGSRDPLGPFIEHYEYRPSGRRYELPPSEVVHIRHGLDPENPRKGRSRLRGQLREIMTDEEAARMTAALAQNLGVPGLVISPKSDEATIEDDEAAVIKTKLDQGTGGSNRGRSVVISGSTDLHEFGFSPEQMTLRDVRAIPEERITAALGVAAAVVGLGTGLAQTKVGAPQPLSARLWTRSGPIRMGDVQVGNEVATPDGWKPVQAIYPQGVQDIYRITFQDGSTAESTIDHLWAVDVPHNGYREAHREALPLSEIAEFPPAKLRRTALPLQGVTEFDEQPTPIPPYLMGMLLSDGSFRRNILVSNTAAEIIDTVREAVPAGYSLKHMQRGDYRISYDDASKGRGKGGGTGDRNPMIDELRRLGLWMKYSHEKFVPDVYKHNSSHVRREVLRGILDGDGYVNLHGQPALEQTSQQLTEDVTWLVQSLGGYTLQSKKRANRRRRFIAGRPMRSRFDRYHLSIVIDDAASLFRYPAKRDKCRRRVKATTRKFRSIEWVRRQQAQCIKLDGSLYLTDYFLVTHNTMHELREMATEQGLVPLWRRNAKGLRRGLLYEFRGGQRDLDLIYDTSDVRVLQEDKTAAHGRDLAAVNGGTLTVAAFQRRQGYPVDEGAAGEVYLRSGLVMEVPATASGRRRPAQRDLKISTNGHAKLTPDQRAGLAFVRYLDRGRAALERNTAAQLEEAYEAFGALAAEAYDALPKQQKQTPEEERVARAIIDALDPAAFRGMTIQPIHNGVYAASVDLVAGGYTTAFDIGISIGERDLIAERVLAAGGRRLGLSDLTAQTREAVYRALAIAREEGLGIPQTSRRIRELVGAGPYPHAGAAYRAETVARTETRWAVNRAVGETGRAAGFELYVAFDDRAGFNDDECMARDGNEFTYEEMIGEGDHPRGTLSFSPVPRTLAQTEVEA